MLANSLKALCLVLVAALLVAGCKETPGDDGRYATHDRGTPYGPNGRLAP